MHVWQKTKTYTIEYWEKGGRWYWHKKFNNDRIVLDGSYKYRRSCRRALRKMFGEPTA